MTLAVYGATGATGRRVIQLASAAGIPVIAVGRNRAALAGLGVEYRVASLAPAELDAAFAGAGVVVSCAGPYTQYGPPVLDAALRAGGCYVDCAGEPRWVQRIIDEFESRAIQTGVAIVPSLGLGVATDIAAGAAAELVGGPDKVRRLRCAVKIVGMRPSPATVRSTVELVAGGAPIVHSGRVRWELAGSRVHRFASGRGALFSTPDALVLARAYPEAHIECHVQPVAMGPALAVGGLVWRIPGSLAVTRALLSRPGHAASHAGGGRSLVTAEAEGTSGRYTVTGAVDDVYDITGRGAFAVAQALLTGPGKRTGLRNAGQFLPPPQRAADDLGVRLAVC
ncbi:NAD(P)H-binding protein [Mycobacterium triplex]|uniref:Saccharopine dehydrogenase n=1 Tax=Mycobacterium triplex TaxID=47839 RepID=A0A024K361_9MYCO|nr:NAD(P)H-binding protein [Mycobacterium triplex]CDO90351.1 saccharopine dehydrogenase [Mycobacterium triplex]